MSQNNTNNQQEGWPEYGDLVIATVNSVMDYGAYANLDEYNRRGFLHISEISSARIRNVRDFVRENQKLVPQSTQGRQRKRPHRPIAETC